MKFLQRLFKNELAVDLGSVNTLIYAPARGILLNEPSVVALEKYTGDVIAVGKEAAKLLGRAPRDIEVHRPIRCGTIFNFEITQKMLKAFLGRVNEGRHGRAHTVVGVPGSATIVEQRSVRDAVKDVAGGRVDLVDEGLAAGLGAGVRFEDERASMESILEEGQRQLQSLLPEVSSRLAVYLRPETPWMKPFVITCAARTVFILASSQPSG